jgi:peptide/nickel transport system permease protein
MMGNLKKILRKPANLIFILLGLGLLFLAFFGKQVAPYNPLKLDMQARLQAPSWLHWMGTDNLGRDIASRVIAATGLDLLSCLVILVGASVIGVLIGLVSGFYGGIVDEVMMRISDVFIAFPGLVLALAISVALGPNLINAMIALVAVWWPSYARLIRVQALALREREYIQAARALGGGSGWVIFRHILPNSLVPLIVLLSTDAAPALVTATALSFIGMGVQPPAAEWGSMVNLGSRYLLDAWWMSTFPGLAILVTVLIFNGLVEIVRDQLSKTHA